ncbi:uncharacterized protein CTRU02_208948 [Colletotrichum truncatum]|uniref:Uncharacterized protein n=1 Tax=Colletotrichum truncatum TaxID=5467 RepID=A0ACC3YXP9_COLTU|nr:uncharacterized protein CTRU02_07861 [Colletotrichum truncatum]KAF6790955.1 hypothetical protein CTRU02_07861 [Colletotrichum truncatum]
MQVQSLAALTALGLAGLAKAGPNPLPFPEPGNGAPFTCPAVATQTVFVTVGSGINPFPPVAVQTITATVWPSFEQSQASLPRPTPVLTVTIDSYGPPLGGSQYTGPKPWETPVVTSTVIVTASAASVVSDPGNAGGNPSVSTIQGGQAPPASPGDNDQSTPTVVTVTAGQTTPALPWNPSGPGVNTNGIVIFTTTLYRARPGSGTPTVDTLVTCFTVTFPSATGTNPAGLPNGAGPASVSTVIVPTMVPGPDGILSYSLQTLVSSITPGTVIPSAPVVTTTYTLPGPGSAVQNPTSVVPVVATLTLTFPQPLTSTIASQLSTPLLPAAPFTVVTVTQAPPPSPPASVVTVIFTSGVPPVGSIPGVPVSVVTQTVIQNDPIPGGYGDSAPLPGFPSSVVAATPAPAPGAPGAPPSGPAVSAPLVSASGIPGGYGDLAVSSASIAMPGSVASFSVITLWPTAPSTLQNTLPGAGASETNAALPLTGTGSSSCTSTLLKVSTTVSSTSVLTSTLVNVVAEATTTYTFPFESLVTSVGTATVTGGVIGGETLINGGTVSASTVSDATIVTALSSLVLSTWVQSTLIQSTLITTGPVPTLIERRNIEKRQGNFTLTSTAPIPVATPMCTGTTEVGTLTLDFDDLPYGSVYNPYHRFWFSKGFIVGPPPSMPYLPSSGGRVLEYVPPMLSNNTGMFSKDTAQIGMGKLASLPCFRFNFYGMDLGCDARKPDQLCDFTFTGYRWDAVQGKELEFVSQNVWVPSCPRMNDCPLTPFTATGFVGLSSILVTLRVDGRPQVWWSDDLQVGWSDNDCNSATCRQQPGQSIVTTDNDPVWYWTPLGIRVLKPSRIHKHF